jgi:hypothetical protein
VIPIVFLACMAAASWAFLALQVTAVTPELYECLRDTGGVAVTATFYAVIRWRGAAIIQSHFRAAAFCIFLSAVLAGAAIVVALGGESIANIASALATPVWATCWSAWLCLTSMWEKIWRRARTKRASPSASLI